MPSYKIKHITRYTFKSPVIDCTNQMMLYPIFNSNLEVRKHDFNISYNPSVEIFTDYFGNKVGVFSIVKPHTELTIISEVDVITKPITVPDLNADVALQWKQLNALKNEFSFMDFFEKEMFASTEEMSEVVKAITDFEKNPFENAKAMSSYIFTQFEYEKGVTDVETKTDDVWRLKAGVCQDFAHILLVMLRIAGIPSRYVSGYICPKEQEQRGEGATHAWVEIYIPDYGWIGLDPTNNCIVNDGHVRLAVGRSFVDCTPVKGTYKGSLEHLLEVSVQIQQGLHKMIEVDFSTVSHHFPSPASITNSYQRNLEIKQQQQ